MDRISPILRRESDPKSPGHVRFVCLSDTHNVTDFFHVPAGDVLLHSGDFSQMGEPEYISHFNRFLATLSFQEKIVIAGNHDLTFDTENFPELCKRFRLPPDVKSLPTKSILTNCTYLEDSGTTVFGYKVWGSPWTPTFCDWAFNLDIGAPIEAKWRLIPDDTDILLTHGPPYDIRDACHDGAKVGCPILRDRVREIRPLVHLFGHIHEAYGVVQTEDTLFVNGSNCNLRYKAVNPPVIFDLPVRN